MNEPRSGRVVSVNVNEGGVPKLPVDEQWVGSLGLADDRHLEPSPVHGGEDQAVCIYSMEAIGRLVAEGHNVFPGGLRREPDAGGDRAGRRSGRGDQLRSAMTGS